MSRLDLLVRAEQLRLERVPYVLATVVRAEKPTSAKPGDAAVVLQDGTIEGFVGGSCAETTVRIESLKVLASRESTLLLITPGEDKKNHAHSPGVVSVSNPCLSGGTLEMFLEPEIPPPLVIVYGHGPIAHKITTAGPHLGFDVRFAVPSEELPVDTDAVIVATHGFDESEILVKAIGAKVPYIGLVASVKRGSAVLDALKLSDTEKSMVHTPAGLDIGAHTPAEIALSIFAEIVLTRPRLEVKDLYSRPIQGKAVVLDPVCAMNVVANESSLYVDYQNTRYWFCGSGCRQAFLFDPSHYISDPT